MRHVVNFAREGGIEILFRRAIIVLVSEYIRVLPGQPRGLEQIAFDAFVVKLRLSSLVRLAYGHFFSGDDAARLTGWIIQVASNNRLRRTDNHACRLEVRLHAMRAEITLGRRIGVGINVERVVRAGLHAAFTANTSAVVKIYDSIRTAVEGFGGTNLDAGSRVAVVTSHHAEVTAGVRKFTFLDVFDPGAKNAHRDLVFLFARHRTGVTPNTSVLVNDKAVAHAVGDRLSYTLDDNIGRG